MQIEHKTERGTVTFILAPKDASGYKLEDNTLTFDVMYGIGKVYHDILPGTNLIGLTSDITEEQAKMVGLSSVSNFRKEIEKLEVYEVNPCIVDDPDTHSQYHGAQMDAWQEAQSRTGKWLVLFKPEI